MNPIRSFEAAISKVWKSDLPIDVKVNNLQKVQGSIRSYIARAEGKSSAGGDPLAVCARQRAIGYLKLLVNDCAYLMESCRGSAKLVGGK